MFYYRNAEMTKELEGSRQMMVKKQSEIDQLQNEVCFVLMGRWSHADGYECSWCFSVLFGSFFVSM